MPNALTAHVGMKAGPWFLETLVKHYFDRVFHLAKEVPENGDDESSGKLRRDELLYDEVFHIVKVRCLSLVCERRVLTRLASPSSKCRPSMCRRSNLLACRALTSQ